MQRGTYRVHGCGRCKKRKIKCDNLQPCCSPCKRLKKPCPGSTSGLIFQNSGTWIPTSGTVVTYDQRQESISRLAIEIGQLNSSPWTPHHWFFTIPQIELAGEFQEVILTPLRAISLALKAIRSADPVLRRRALQYYDKSLAQQRHQMELLRVDGSRASTDLILPTLLTAVLLLEFEIMAPQEQYSWMGHASGSMQLLELLGPEACQVSPLFEIFWQLRFSMRYMSLLTGKAPWLDEARWRDVPFLPRGKTTLDTLIDPRSEAFRNGDAGIAEMTPAQRMTRILCNNRRLRPPTGPMSAPEDLKEASRYIISDAEHILNQESTSFRMALQCTFSIHLVFLYTPCETQRQTADTIFRHWHSRLTL